MGWWKCSSRGVRSRLECNYIPETKKTKRSKAKTKTAKPKTRSRARQPNSAVVPVSIPPTPGGEWLLGMLSPSHSNVGHRQPGGSRLPTVATKYRRNITIPTPPLLENGGTWNMEVFQRADPVLPLVVRTYVPTAQEEVPKYNYYYLGPGTDDLVNISPRDLSEMTIRFRTGKQAYRLNGQSVTGIPSIPQMLAPGNIVSAQCEMRPLKMAPVVLQSTNVDGKNLLFGLGDWYPHITTSSARTPAQPFVHFYTEPPPIDKLLTGTVPYQASAKAGFYQPLRIAPRRMISTDSYVTVFGSNANTLEESVTTVGYTMDQLGTGFPYYLTLSEGYHPCMALHPYSYIAGLTKVEGLPYGASFRLVLVQDLEFIPQLDDVEWCGNAQPPPAPEAWVMQTYETVVAVLQDAYPAAFNDSSLLLKKIKALVRKILPYISTGVNLAAYATGMPELVAAGRIIDRFDALLQHTNG